MYLLMYGVQSTWMSHCILWKLQMLQMLSSNKYLKSPRMKSIAQHSNLLQYLKHDLWFLDTLKNEHVKIDISFYIRYTYASYICIDAHAHAYLFVRISVEQASRREGDSRSPMILPIKCSPKKKTEDNGPPDINARHKTKR